MLDGRLLDRELSELEGRRVGEVVPSVGEIVGGRYVEMDGGIELYKLEMTELEYTRLDDGLDDDNDTEYDDTEAIELDMTSELERIGVEDIEELYWLAEPDSIDDIGLETIELETGNEVMIGGNTDDGSNGNVKENTSDEPEDMGGSVGNAELGIVRVRETADGNGERMADDEDMLGLYGTENPSLEDIDSGGSVIFPPE